MLTAAYKAEVQYRGRAFVPSVDTAVQIRSLAEFLTGDSPRFGVLMCGTWGNGKTTLLYAFRSVVGYLSSCGYFDGDRRVLVMDSRDLSKSYRNRDPKVFEDICREHILAIEDMGKEPTETLDYGNVISPVVELLERRYDKQLFTLITTNLNPKEIREKYGARIADRFNEMMEVLNFGAADTFRKCAGTAPARPAAPKKPQEPKGDGRKEPEKTVTWNEYAAMRGLGK